ncbi:DUF6069 family protein [Actinoplanes couchii]|nr:DUF6069 family protein [Actinoplanes couchii]MDR6318848.1 stage V sporulation protein SpoVS [Actinoplanes couchii]
MAAQDSTLVAQQTTPLRVAGGIALAAIGSVAVNAVIAMLAHAAGASDEFMPLTIGAYGFLSVVGVLIAAIGWAVIRRAAKQPAAVFRWLVPTIVVVSLIPDVLLLTGEGQPGTGIVAVVALMLMHVAVAAVAVPIFRRVMPLPR